MIFLKIQYKQKKMSLTNIITLHLHTYKKKILMLNKSSKSFIVTGVLLMSLLYLSFEQNDVYKCSSQQIEETCPTTQNNQVCALNQQSIYQTYASACQVCKLGHVQEFTQGECQCPKVTCLEQQSCFQGICIPQKLFKVDKHQQTAVNLYNAGHFKKALKLINLAIQTNPGSAYLFYLKANCYYQIKNNKQALRSIKAAIQRQGSNADYYVMRGRIMTELNMKVQAEKQYEKAKQLGYKDMGQLYYYEGQNLLSDERYEEAIKKFQAAIELHPDNVQWILRKVMAYLINDQHAMALIALKQAKKQNPTQRQKFQIKGLTEQITQMQTGQHSKVQREQQKNARLSTGKQMRQPRIQQDSEGNVKILNQHGQEIPMGNNQDKKEQIQTEAINLDQTETQVEIEATQQQQQQVNAQAESQESEGGQSSSQNQKDDRNLDL